MFESLTVFCLRYVQLYVSNGFHPALTQPQTHQQIVSLNAQSWFAASNKYHLTGSEYDVYMYYSVIMFSYELNALHPFVWPMLCITENHKD